MQVGNLNPNLLNINKANMNLGLYYDQGNNNDQMIDINNINNIYHNQNIRDDHNNPNFKMNMVMNRNNNIMMNN